MPNVKVHQSAICIIPPKNIWSQIQAIRAVHDKSYIRWMPHINLMYPFYEDVGSNFEKAGQSAAEALKNIQPFEISLDEFQYFRHNRSSTLWLNPQTRPENRLQTLHSALLGVFPDCTDLSNDPRRGINTFTPHLSVGQWGQNCRPKSDAADAAAQQAQLELQTAWDSVPQFEVTSVALISRRGKTDPFTVRPAFYVNRLVSFPVMTAAQNGLMTSKNDNNPPPNSSAVVTGAQRWSPFQTEGGPGFTGHQQQQQQGGSRSTVVSGFGVYSNPSSRTVTTSHMGQQGYPSVEGSVRLSGLPINVSTSAPGGNDGTNPTHESQRANLQALMSQLAGSMPLSGSNTASTTFLNDPNNPVTQILMGIDNAAAIAPKGTGGGSGDVQLSQPLTSTALVKVHSGTIIDKDGNVQDKEGNVQEGQEEKKNSGDGGSGGKAYGLRNRKLKLPEELLRDEADEDNQGGRPATADDGTDREFKKGFDQDGDLTDEFDDDDLEDEYNEADEEEDKLEGGKSASRRRSGRRSRPSKASSPSTTAAAGGGGGGGSTRGEQQQRDGNDTQAGFQAQQEQQYQGRTITSNRNDNENNDGGYSMLPVGQVGRPRGYAGDPDLSSLGEEDRRRLKRRIANRESARRVRAKRQEMVDELQQKITALSHQNARLLAHIATAEQSRQSIQGQLSMVRERFAMKLQENNNLLTECAALRHALQEKGINPADAIADLVKHAHQQQQQQANGNHSNSVNDAANAIARASSLLQAGGGGGGNGINGGASAFFSSAFNSLPCSTQATLHAFSAPMNINTQPVTSAVEAAAAAAAAAAAILPPVTSAGMAPTLTGFNLS
ncbi:hypothetical protein Ndes2437B_g00302 [Nannochloris sp. 'desiccata']